MVQIVSGAKQPPFFAPSFLLAGFHLLMQHEKPLSAFQCLLPLLSWESLIPLILFAPSTPNTLIFVFGNVLHMILAQKKCKITICTLFTRLLYAGL